MCDTLGARLHVKNSSYQCTVYPKKYAQGFVVLCFVVVMQLFIMISHEVFIHIHQGCFAGIGAIVRLPQCQWSKPDVYGTISQCITTTKHSKAKTVCILLGIYCMSIIKIWRSHVRLILKERFYNETGPRIAEAGFWKQEKTPSYDACFSIWEPYHMKDLRAKLTLLQLTTLYSNESHSSFRVMGSCSNYRQKWCMLYVLGVKKVAIIINSVLVNLTVIQSQNIQSMANWIGWDLHNYFVPGIMFEKSIASVIH